MRTISTPTRTRPRLKFSSTISFAKLFQGEPSPLITAGMNGSSGGVGQYISEREFQLHHHRSDANDSTRHAAQSLSVFVGNRPDLEQSAFVQDLIRLGNWTINAGLRWDHYQLLLNRQAVDPRSRFRAISLRRIWYCISPTTGLPDARLSRTSCFPVQRQPSIPEPGFLRLPVEPSEGNYYEAGLTKASLPEGSSWTPTIFGGLVNNYADDDQIENTTISFPIAFRKAIIYGAEAKLDLPDWHRFSGFLSYSYTWASVVSGDGRPLSGRRRGADTLQSAISRIRRISATRFADASLSSQAALLDRRRAFNMIPVCLSISTGLTLCNGGARRIWTAGREPH
jgi:outer membrane receptor protein involved in Fe transport